MSLLKQFLLQIECVLRTLLPDPLYKVKGKINSAAEPQGRGWERDGHWESIAPVFEGLLSCCFFFNQEIAFFKRKKKSFILVFLGFFLIHTKLVMGSVIDLKVIRSSLKPEVFSLVYLG